MINPAYAYFSWNVAPSSSAVSASTQHNHHGRMARVIDGDHPAILAGQANIEGFFSSQCLKHITSPAGMYALVSWISFIMQAIISLVLIFSHISDVKVGTTCTDTDVPHNCWKKLSGDFRAMNFSATTTALTYNPLPLGMYVGIDETHTLQTQYPFQLFVNADARTMSHDAANCSNMMQDKDPNALTACKAANIPSLFAVPNHLQYVSLTGGVHMVFFIWLALHISASFTLIMLPAKKAHHLKQYVLMIWHAWGVLLSIMLYANDDYYNMRIPVNNVILAVVIEFLSVIIQYSWTVTALENVENKYNTLIEGPDQAENRPLHTVVNSDPSPGNEDENMLPEAGEGNANMFTQSAVMKAMRIDTGVVQRSDVKRVPHVGMPGMNYNNDDMSLIYEWDVYKSKAERMELLEPLLIQCAITLPLVLIAVMCIGHRVQMDYLVQTVFLRVFLCFAALAISERIAAIARRDKVTLLTVTEATLITQLILVASVAVMMIYTFIDWYYPFYLTNHTYRALGSLWGSWHVMHVALGFTTALLFVIYVYKFIQIWLTNLTNVKFTEYNQIIYVVTLANFLLLTFYATIGILAIMPDTWYSAYDVKDVLLNYN